MGSETPIRNHLGTIVGLRPKDEPDSVQATLDASLKAVGVAPQVTTPPVQQKPLQRTSWPMVAAGAAVLCIFVLVVVFLGGRIQPAPRVVTLPSTAVSVTPAPSPTTIVTVMPQANSRLVTLPAIALFGDYDERTRIGLAPDGLSCTLAGQSPDTKWVYLSCPAPTGLVWAKVGDLGLSAKQRDALIDTRVISRSVPTAPAFSSPNPQSAAPSLAFCADRSSLWGKTHQCAATQAAADTLADGEIGRINATAEAKQRKP